MSDNEAPGDAGYDEFVAAVDDGEGYYFECPNGHTSLPPRRVCPHCGSTELIDVTLPDTGEIRTYTRTAVATPAFADDAPYTLAIASFGPVEVTAQLRGADEISIGDEVSLGVDERTTTGDPLLVFDPE